MASPDLTLVTRTDLEEFVPTNPGQYADLTDFLDENRVERVTDDWPAYQRARATGKPVYIPAGDFWFMQSLAHGDGSVLRGAGKRKTVLHIHDNAPASIGLITNENLNGNTQAYFSDFTLDGNCYRQNGTLDAAGGSQSSTLTFRNVKHFYVDRVESINALLHGFDVTRGSIAYPYGGDGVLATLRSSDVYFDKIEASNFGDDGFTVHSSDFVHVSNSIFRDPRKRTNNNGIEFDGDSRFCTSTNNRTYNCYAGIEIKGHENESAGQHMVINGHIDTGSVRSYNFRHIGFHSGSDPVSTTAQNIIASNLVSIHPNNDGLFQDDAGVRSLVISAYVGVTINGFTSIGRGDLAAIDCAVALQFKSRGINLNGVNISGWVGSDRDISITTGSKVNISNVFVHDSGARAVYTSAGVSGINITNLIAEGGASGLHGIDIWDIGAANITNSTCTGYSNAAIREGGVNFSSLESFNRRTYPVPSNVTQLIDLDPTRDYYASPSVFTTLTDRPTGHTGGHFVTHSRVSGGICMQTIFRNTTTPADQYQAWRRVDIIGKGAGPWNVASFTQAT